MPALLLTRERDRPEAVGVAAAGGTLGLEGDLARGQYAPLDRVHLGDKVAIPRERDVAALEENLEVGRPALLRLVREGLTPDLRIVARQVLGEVHADAAAVHRQPRHG